MDGFDGFVFRWAMTDEEPLSLSPTVYLCTTDVLYVGAFILRIYVNFRQQQSWWWGRWRAGAPIDTCSYAKLFVSLLFRCFHFILLLFSLPLFASSLSLALPFFDGRSTGRLLLKFNYKQIVLFRRVLHFAPKISCFPNKKDENGKS